MNLPEKQIAFTKDRIGENLQPAGEHFGRLHSEVISVPHAEQLRIIGEAEGKGKSVPSEFQGRRDAEVVTKKNPDLASEITDKKPKTEVVNLHVESVVGNDTKMALRSGAEVKLESHLQEKSEALEQGIKSEAVADRVNERQNEKQNDKDIDKLLAGRKDDLALVASARRLNQ